MLTGSIVALITPMHADGSVNYEQLQALVEWHIANGTDAIVAVGTTGESATLSVDEHLKVVETVIKTANKRIPVVAGAGANNTREAIVLAQAAEKLGADYTTRCLLSLTTTNLRKKACINTSKPLPKPLPFP